MSEDYCDSCPKHVDSHPLCDMCEAHGVWSIQNLEGPNMDPITRWFACGRHLHRVLSDANWELDAVMVMRLEFDGYTRS